MSQRLGTLRRDPAKLGSFEVCFQTIFTFVKSCPSMTPMGLKSASTTIRSSIFRFSKIRRASTASEPELIVIGDSVMKMDTDFPRKSASSRTSLRMSPSVKIPLSLPFSSVRAMHPLLGFVICWRHSSQVALSLEIANCPVGRMIESTLAARDLPMLPPG